VLRLIRLGELVGAIDAETTEIFSEEFSLKNQHRSFLTVSLSRLWRDPGNFHHYYFNWLDAKGTIEWD
jgi:hypothetical protein